MGDCADVIGDKLDSPVSWRGGPDITQLSSRAIRLRIAMSDCDLYALRFGR